MKGITNTQVSTSIREEKSFNLPRYEGDYERGENGHSVNSPVSTCPGMKGITNYEKAVVIMTKEVSTCPGMKGITLRCFNLPRYEGDYEPPEDNLYRHHPGFNLPRYEGDYELLFKLLMKSF